MFQHRPPLHMILCQVHPSPILTTNVLKIYLNIILPSAPRSTKLSLSNRLHKQNFECISCILIQITCAAHGNTFYFTNKEYQTTWKAQISSLCNILNFPLLHLCYVQIFSLALLLVTDYLPSLFKPIHKYRQNNCFIDLRCLEK
jgi:hypothetical protein